MPNYHLVNKADIKREKQKHGWSYEFLAKRCGLSYAEFYAVLYHKSSFVQLHTYLCLAKFFVFDDLGHIIRIPYVEEQERVEKAELDKEKQRMIINIREQERRKLLKMFLTYCLMFTGICAIIAFGYDDLLEWLK